MDNQNVIPVKTNILIADIIKLIINYNSADDKYDRDSKLKNNQRISEPATFKALCQLTFQHFHRPKRRKKKCRVAPRNNANY